MTQSIKAKLNRAKDLNLLQQAVNDNQLLLAELRQLLELISNSSPRLYSENHPLLNSTSLGGHIRHLLEHYQIFFKAFQNQTPIDYDHRPRCHQCQNCIENAQLVIDDILHDLKAMPQQDESVAVSIITNPALSDMVSQSSLLREMQFLQSHTVHHLAIIGIVLRQEGISLAGDMTKAPSTVQYEQDFA